MDNRFTITVEFDSSAWKSLDAEGKKAWLNSVIDMLNEEVYVSGVAYN